MKLKLFILFIFIINIVVAQKKQKGFNQNIFDYKNKNDTIPFLKIEKEDFDTLIIYSRTMPIEAERVGANCYKEFSFKVDRNGKINSIKQLSSEIELPKGRYFKNSDSEPTLHAYFRKESERLINLTESFWQSDSIREKNELYIKIIYYSSLHDAMNQSKNSNMIMMGSGVESMALKKELYNHGVKKFQLKKYDLAKLYFEQSIIYFPKDIDAHYNLASCYLKLKDNEKACKHWNKCLELGDESVKKELTNYCK